MVFICTNPACPSLKSESRGQLEEDGLCEVCESPLVRAELWEKLVRQFSGTDGELRLSLSSSMGVSLPPLPELPPLPSDPPNDPPEQPPGGGRRRGQAFGGGGEQNRPGNLRKVQSSVRTGTPSEQASAMVLWWSQFLDKYDTIVDPDTRSIQTQHVEMYKQRVTVETLFGSTNVQTFLHKNTVVSTEKREQFLREFAQHLLTVPTASEENTRAGRGENAKLIGLEALVGNLKLYKRALEEERNSPAYRNAVVMLGVQNYAKESVAQNWTLPKHFVVGGSSGAGKTFGTRTILRLLIRTAQSTPRLKDAFYTDGGPKNPTPGQTTKVKYIVSVDGGDARAASQIRKMVLQCALVLGYKGITDLHSNSSVLDIKDHIKEAAFAPGSVVHVVEPRTFSDMRIETYNKIVEDPKRVVFCIVNTPPEVIQNQGVKRAWYDLSKGSPKSTYIQINNPNVGCESKKYSAGGLEWGARKSENALSKYIRDCGSKKLTPVVVVLNNNARVVSDEVKYSKPNLGIYFGQMTTSFGTLKLIFRGERVELPQMNEAQEQLKNNQRILKGLNGISAGQTVDSTVLTLDTPRGFLYAADFDVNFFAPG